MSDPFTTPPPTAQPQWLQALLQGVLGSSGINIPTKEQPAGPAIGPMLFNQGGFGLWGKSFGPATPPVTSGAPAASPPAAPIATIVQPPRVQSRMPIGPGPQQFTMPTGLSSGFPSIVSKLEGTGANPRSSASGPYQFLDSTFEDFLKSQHPELAKQLGTPEYKDPITHRAAITTLKSQYGDEAFSWLTNDNAKVLATKGIPVNDATLYGAHFLGAGDFSKVWSANPNTPVAQLGLGKGVIESNPEILAGKTAGEVKTWLQQKTSGNLLPQPPAAGAPPQMAAPSSLNFDKYQQFLEGAKPTPPSKELQDQIRQSAVLGGLARGAASVSATEPGSFARALAAAGGESQVGLRGALEGQLQREENFQNRMQAYNQMRAGSEFGMITAQHANEKEQHEVAFQNATAAYNTNVSNQLRQYEAQLKEFDLKMPKLHTDTNGITVSQINPQTGNMDVKFTPTKPLLDHAENLLNLTKAMGAPGPVAESMLVQHIASTIKDPLVARAVLEKEAVRRTIASGAGGSVFGTEYEKSLKAADKLVDSSGILKAKDPVAYQKALEEAAASDIFNKLQQHGDRGWLKAAAAQGSTIASVLISGE